MARDDSFFVGGLCQWKDSEPSRIDIQTTEGRGDTVELSGVRVKLSALEVELVQTRRGSALSL